MFIHLFETCSITCGSQPVLQNNMARRNEQENCNISFMNPDEETKIYDWFVQMYLSMWIAADFEGENIPVDDPQRKTLFVMKPKAVSYNIKL